MQKKTIMLKVCSWPGNLVLFINILTYYVETDKYTCTLTTIITFTYLRGPEVKHLTVMRKVPSSYPGFGKLFMFAFLLCCCFCFIFVSRTHILF